MVATLRRHAAGEASVEALVVAHAPVATRLPSDTAPATAATTSSKRSPTDVKGSTVGLGDAPAERVRDGEAVADDVGQPPQSG